MSQQKMEPSAWAVMLDAETFADSSLHHTKDGAEEEIEAWEPCVAVLLPLYTSDTIREAVERVRVKADDVDEDMRPAYAIGNALDALLREIGLDPKD